MFTLTGRTFITFDDKFGRSTVSMLTHSQGNSDENEWFSLLLNLIASNSKLHVASFRGMVVDIDKVKSIIFQDNIQEQWTQKRLKRFVLDKLQNYERNFLKNF